MDPMFIELMAKTFGLLASIYTAYKLIFDGFWNRKVRLRDEYKFVKDFIADVTTHTKPHPYLVEKGFAAITGKDNLTSVEILYLLGQPNPSLSLKRYSSSRQSYVEFNEIAQCIEFKVNYSDEKKRKRAKILNGIGYFIFASFALAPIFFATNLFGNNWIMAVVFILLFLGAFAPLAVMFILEVNKIVRGELLVSSQKTPNLALKRDAAKARRPLASRWGSQYSVGQL